MTRHHRTDCQTGQRRDRESQGRNDRTVARDVTPDAVVVGQAYCPTCTVWYRAASAAHAGH